MQTYLRMGGIVAVALATLWPQLSVSAGSYAYGNNPKALSDQQSFDSTTEQGRINKKHNALLALRAEGLKLRDADGGKLTPEHEAYLQAKLDAINAGNY
ncbi:MAG TPA: hypothetical protein VMU22_03530 [Rhizomicrobium sp.]|nr:hypothetical protein [Rhizomicrobium sp.]